MEEEAFDYTKRKKKDKKRWCKGKHGVEHKIFHYKGIGKRAYHDEDRCAVCDKVFKTHWHIRFSGWDNSCHKLTRNPE